MPVQKSHISQWGASSGLEKHEAAGQVLFWFWWCTELENVWFSHEHEFLFISYDLYETSRQTCRNRAFLHTHFLHGLCLGQGINTRTAVLTTCRMEGNTWWQICPTLPILSLKPSSKPKILSNMRKALLSAQHWPDGGIQIPRIPLLQYYKGILFNPIQFNSKVFIWQWLVLREYNKLKKLQPLMLLDANAVWDLITWKRTDLRIRKGRKKKIRTNGWLVIPLMLAPQQSRHAVQRQ